MIRMKHEFMEEITAIFSEVKKDTEMLELSVPNSTYSVVEGIRVGDLLEVKKMDWYSEQVLPQMETQEGIKELFNKTVSQDGESKFESQFMAVLLYFLYILRYAKIGVSNCDTPKLLNRVMLFISWMLISNDRESSIECTI